MKRKLVLTFLSLIIALFLLLSFGFLFECLEPVVRQKIFKTMTVDEFLYDKDTNHWNELYLNKDGNVEYKNMVIVKDNDHKPINNKTAYTNTEFILYFRAEGIRPEEWGCDQSDRAKNGTLGCYLLAPGEKPR